MQDLLTKKLPLINLADEEDEEESLIEGLEDEDEDDDDDNDSDIDEEKEELLTDDFEKDDGNY